MLSHAFLSSISILWLLLVFKLNLAPPVISLGFCFPFMRQRAHIKKKRKEKKKKMYENRLERMVNDFFVSKVRFSASSSYFSSSAFPAASPSFTISTEILVYMIVSYPTIQVAIIRPHGWWCVVVVILLLAFTRLRPDMNGMPWNAYMHRPNLGLYSHPKGCREWSQNLRLLQGKNLPNRMAPGRVEHAMLHHAESKPKALPT